MIDSPRCLVDTNVLVYAFSDPSDPKQAQAKSLVDSLIINERICLSTQILQELYVNLVKKKQVAPDAARQLIEDLSVFPVFKIDLPAILQSATLSAWARISFWDALILNPTKRLGAMTVYSDDLNSGQSYDGVEVLNPFQ
jgi:predicted nucleic acid-binding protein